MTDEAARQRGLAAVLLAAVLWSTGGLFIKWVDLDALGVVMWRSLLAGITMWVILRPRLVAPWRMSKLTWALAISYAMMLLLFVTANKLTTAANAIFLQYTAPLYVIALAHILFRERATRLDVGTVALAFGGMALFFVGRLETDDALGNLSAIGSGVAFASFLVLLRHPACSAADRPVAMVMGNFGLAAGLAAVNGVAGRDAFTPDASDVAGLLVLGVVQIGLAYVVFTYGIAYVAALEASLIGMLEPVLNPVWVFLFLGETPGRWAVAGGAVIVAAVAGRTVILERGRRVEVPAAQGVHG